MLWQPFGTEEATRLKREACSSLEQSGDLASQGLLPPWHQATGVECQVLLVHGSCACQFAVVPTCPYCITLAHFIYSHHCRPRGTSNGNAMTCLLTRPSLQAASAQREGLGLIHLWAVGPSPAPESWQGPRRCRPTELPSAPSGTVATNQLHEVLEHLRKTFLRRRN